MAKTVMDRRVHRTRAMLQHALNSLIPKKGYEAAWWLDAGAKLPPERMDAMFRHLATEGILASKLLKVLATPRASHG